MLALSLSALTACTTSSTIQGTNPDSDFGQDIQQVVAQTSDCPSTIDAALAMDKELAAFANQIPENYAFTVQEVLQWADTIESLGTVYNHAYGCSNDDQFAQQRDIYYQWAFLLRQSVQPSDFSLEADVSSWEEICDHPDFIESCMEQVEANIHMMEEWIDMATE